LNPAFCALDATNARPSVPPEQLLLASLLQAFYGIGSGTFLEKLMAAPELKPLSRPKPPSPVSQGQRHCARWRAPARRRAGRCFFTISRPASISAGADRDGPSRWWQLVCWSWQHLQLKELGGLVQSAVVAGEGNRLFGGDV
jgi:hypothetical protein